MLTASEKVADGRALNLSTGIATSFKAYAWVVWEIVHGGQNGPEVKNTASKPEAVFARYGSIRLQEALGFHHRTNLSGGIPCCLYH